MADGCVYGLLIIRVTIWGFYETTGGYESFQLGRLVFHSFPLKGDIKKTITGAFLENMVKLKLICGMGLLRDRHQWCHLYLSATKS